MDGRHHLPLSAGFHMLLDQAKHSVEVVSPVWALNPWDEETTPSTAKQVHCHITHDRLPESPTPTPPTFLGHKHRKWMTTIFFPPCLSEQVPQIPTVFYVFFPKYVRLDIHVCHNEICISWKSLSWILSNGRSPDDSVEPKRGDWDVLFPSISLRDWSIQMTSAPGLRPSKRELMRGAWLFAPEKAESR